LHAERLPDPGIVVVPAVRFVVAGFPFRTSLDSGMLSADLASDLRHDVAPSKAPRGDSWQSSAWGLSFMPPLPHRTPARSLPLGRSPFPFRLPLRPAPPDVLPGLAEHGEADGHVADAQQPLCRGVAPAPVAGYAPLPQ